MRGVCDDTDYFSVHADVNDEAKGSYIRQMGLLESWFRQDMLSDIRMGLSEFGRVSVAEYGRNPGYSG